MSSSSATWIITWGAGAASCGAGPTSLLISITQSLVGGAALLSLSKRSSLHSGPTSITGSSAGLLDPEAAGVALCFNAFALKTASAEVTGG